nr:porin family protein [Bacteroidota bacterium]
MKKIVLMIAAIALILNANAQDKAFEKGNVVVGLGAGLGIYKTKIHSEQTYGGIKYSDDTTDAAASAIFPLMVEYGVTNWLGIGAKFAFSNYFEETDSISGRKATTRAIDAGLLINFHLVKSRRFDMPIVVNVGYSNFKISNNDIYDSQAKD